MNAWNHSVLCEAIRHMPRSNTPVIMDGVASLPHVPKNKRRAEKPPVVRVPVVRYLNTLDEGFERETCYDSLIASVLEDV